MIEAGDIFVFGLLPGGSQSHVRKALPVQFEPQLAQLRPRQLARALHHDSQRSDLVDVVADEAREIVEEVFRAIGGTIAARHLGQLVGVMGNGQNRTITLRAPIENWPKGRPILEPCGQIRRRAVPDTLQSGLGLLAGGRPIAAACLVGKATDFAAPFDGELVADGGAVTVVPDACQLLKQLLERETRVHHDRLHVGEIFEVRVEVNRIEDTEGLLADFVAKPRRAPEHLFVKDAAVDPTDACRASG
jgi:hypothetical protein